VGQTNKEQHVSETRMNEGVLLGKGGQAKSCGSLWTNQGIIRPSGLLNIERKDGRRGLGRFSPETEIGATTVVWRNGRRGRGRVERAPQG